MKILSSKVLGEIFPIVLSAGFVISSQGEIQAMEMPLNPLTSSYSGKSDVPMLKIPGEEHSSEDEKSNSQDFINDSVDKVPAGLDLRSLQRDHILNKSPNSSELSPKSPKRRSSFEKNRENQEKLEKAIEAIETNNYRQLKKVISEKKRGGDWLDPNSTDSRGRPLFILAVEAFIKSKETNPEDKFKILNQLLEFGALVDGQDTFGRTALWRVVYYRSTDYLHNDLIEFLVNNGADVRLSNFDGISPVNIAETESLSDVLEILQRSPTFSTKDSDSE